MANGLLVTIDGPSGAGKTTVSRELAHQLNYRYVDTGALYRAIALTASERHICADDDAGLEKLCRKLDLRFIADDSGLRLLANGRDVTDRIRTPEVTMLASAVSARPAVRRYLLDVQRAIGRGKHVVFEGRDMGTVVFPDADVKFFLDASPASRALRRFSESSGKTDQSLEKVAEQMHRRDGNDSSRTLAPLKKAADAVCIDSTRMSAAQVVAVMVDHVRTRCDS